MAREMETCLAEQGPSGAEGLVVPSQGRNKRIVERVLDHQNQRIHSSYNITEQPADGYEVFGPNPVAQQSPPTTGLVHNGSPSQVLQLVL